MREVLLFVCSKMTDETNLSSKLSVADRTREVYEASPLCLILCNLFPRLCWYVEVFKGDFEGVLVLLLLTTMGAFSDL